MNRRNYRWNGIDLLHKLADLPQEAVEWIKGKAQTIAHEKKLLTAAHRIPIDPFSVEALRKRLQWKLALQEGNAESAKEPPETGPDAKEEDQKLLERILRERDVHIRNNVTRTAAYLHMYREHPELHWALLAHMVSRNGGWSMTDLRGDLLPFLLNEEQRENIFAFLERANALIFRDAYPQLLLYRASVQLKRPLFYLLPLLGVSRFMRPVWDRFWIERESGLLTIALIVNEQHYIEERVVRHPSFQSTVLDTLFFQTQTLLQLNQVVFPYVQGDRIRLAGLILENFSSVRERIEVGKKLYAILFGIRAVAEGAQAFACGRRHSGSRADYWPHLFAPVRKEPPRPRGQLLERLDGCKLRPGAAPLYSPALTDAWRDRDVESPIPGDWFRDLSVLDYFTEISAPFSFEMTQECGLGLKKIELAVLAGDLIV
ncbi:DUF2515 domain-containing protein [Paenibacillus sp. MZ04-78.2]|uniref:DUF2515 domain-containing protein n=1 Tax=Paenibacillus sp. MZ04-78.2 TaxID=2962034 RepID=UPI0020B7D308|nr:DUF2515 domain-containing protein [Paenibacillus sp. MZ04-78.2]MCP3774710.1 DUF2515 domain-containing protein [Paenibacillus sp. MZ04-78.2]